MSELRKDSITGRCVIIASNRASRPDDFQRDARLDDSRDCPFCAGNEHETPKAVVTYQAANGQSTNPAWQVRVVPNKYPALEMATNGQASAGVHEVIVESPQHVSSLTELLPEQAHLTFMTYRDRLRHFSQDAQIQFVQIFKNVGAAAGASLEHAHSQLIAMCQTPDTIESELRRRRERLEHAGACSCCQTLAEEIDAGTRIVAVTERFVALCPFVSRFPFEIWIMPRRHASSFEQQDDDQLAELSSLLQELIQRIEDALNRPSYNYLIRSTPFAVAANEYDHWHIELFPRLTNPAGFEWATGYFINPTAPEDAASVLRGSRIN